jgi:hypothetical protein
MEINEGINGVHESQRRWMKVEGKKGREGKGRDGMG